MATSLEAFYQEFFQDVLSEAHLDGDYHEDAFVESFCSFLVEAGDIETFDRVSYAAARGARIDGYGGDPLDSDGVLSLIIADFNQAPDISSLTSSDMDAIFKRAIGFLTKAHDPEFRDSIDESSPAFGLADTIAARWPKITKVRMILISNRILSTRIDGRPEGEFEGVPVTYSVWDIGRLHRFVTSGQGREEIEIDLVQDFGGPLAALPAHLTDAGYEAYLIVIPGSQLASIYDHWGTRLLEQNVRVFLQARGNVNKGIRNTIENDPKMFFAYNNGITATAESVRTTESQTGLMITQLKNLQIVNGGQTTASIHAASRKKELDLSKLFVQMKLSIVAPEQSLDVVPKISEYANSQNRVNAADFFSNHPFHVRMEVFSRRIFAPSQDGAFRETKWFYERARGQYQDARGDLTVAQRRKFDHEHPRRQLLSKTDLAKFVNVWHGLPHVVSRGAQKNFADFAGTLGSEWEKNPDQFNERYFHHAIARAIVFRETEKIVGVQPWYDGGYRANIVAYAIAKLAFDVHRRNQAVNLDKIWKDQAISPAMRDALAISAKASNDIIIGPPTGMRNISEWAKQQACWSQVSKVTVAWPSNWIDELVSADEQHSAQKHAVKDQKVLNGIEAQTAVFNAGPELWHNVMQRGNERRLLSTTDLGCLRVATQLPVRVPTEKQSMRILDALHRLHEEGCQVGRDLTKAS